MSIIRKIKLLPNAFLGYDRSNPSRNGEYKFLHSYIKDNMTIIDAGAHDGTYAEYIFNLVPSVTIHCFEPTASAYKELTARLTKEIKAGKLIANNTGLNTETGEAELFIYNELDQRNSLHLNPAHEYDSSLLHREKIMLTTLDDYIEKNNISNVDFLKIDVEGHEAKVIEGASNALKKKIIRCIQFEYNNNWAAAGFSLGNVFNLLVKLGYKFYRLTFWGRLPINRFKNDLENFKHTNYIAILEN
ncbi:MAG: FkbM family methyltransferase [bacterium]|nr:FkbM family methyltransferase [bacterium]